MVPAQLAAAGDRLLLRDFAAPERQKSFGGLVGFDDRYRLSAHAVVTNSRGQVLLIKQSYGDRRWGLPGGGVEPGETVHEALHRECREELGLDVEIDYLSGVYYHAEFDCHALIFRCAIPQGATITLSNEHDEWRFVDSADLAPVQRRRVEDCLEFDGQVKSAAFPTPSATESR